MHDVNICIGVYVTKIVKRCLRVFGLSFLEAALTDQCRLLISQHTAHRYSSQALGWEGDVRWSEERSWYSSWRGYSNK